MMLGGRLRVFVDLNTTEMVSSSLLPRVNTLLLNAAPCPVHDSLAKNISNKQRFIIGLYDDLGKES